VRVAYKERRQEKLSKFNLRRLVGPLGVSKTLLASFLSSLETSETAAAAASTYIAAGVGPRAQQTTAPAVRGSIRFSQLNLFIDNFGLGSCERATFKGKRCKPFFLSFSGLASSSPPLGCV
jgi:hypothetical protein